MHSMAALIMMAEWLMASMTLSIGLNSKYKNTIMSLWTPLRLLLNTVSNHTIMAKYDLTYLLEMFPADE